MRQLRDDECTNVVPHDGSIVKEITASILDMSGIMALWSH